MCRPERLSALLWNREIQEQSVLFQASPPSSWDEGSVDLSVETLARSYSEVQKLWINSQIVFPLLCQGIVKRDEIVFRAARRRGIPILMVTSGGYQKKTARIIADSILNLHQQGLIGAEAMEGEGSSSLAANMMGSCGPAGSTMTAV